MLPFKESPPLNSGISKKILTKSFQNTVLKWYVSRVSLSFKQEAWNNLWWEMAHSRSFPKLYLPRPVERMKAPLDFCSKPLGVDANSIAKMFEGWSGRKRNEASAVRRTRPTFWACCPFPTRSWNPQSTSQSTGRLRPAAFAWSQLTASPEAQSFSLAVSHRRLFPWNILFVPDFVKHGRCPSAETQVGCDAAVWEIANTGSGGEPSFAHFSWNLSMRCRLLEWTPSKQIYIVSANCSLFEKFANRNWSIFYKYKYI